MSEIFEKIVKLLAKAYPITKQTTTHQNVSDQSRKFQIILECSILF